MDSGLNVTLALADLEYLAEEVKILKYVFSTEKGWKYYLDEVLRLQEEIFNLTKEILKKSKNENTKNISRDQARRLIRRLDKVWDDLDFIKTDMEIILDSLD